MIIFNLQKVNFSLNKKVDCVISYNPDQEIVDIKYSDNELGSFNFNGDDLFAALEKLRAFLEQNGFLILCAGSMPNVYPSRMSRQMSNGRKAYKHKYGKKPDKDDIIDIFQAVEIDKVGTIEEQKNFMKSWNSYFER